MHLTCFGKDTKNLQAYTAAIDAYTNGRNVVEDYSTIDGKTLRKCEIGIVYGVKNCLLRHDTASVSIPKLCEKCQEDGVNQRTANPITRKYQNLGDTPILSIQQLAKFMNATQNGTLINPSDLAEHLMAAIR